MHTIAITCVGPVLEKGLDSVEDVMTSRIRGRVDGQIPLSPYQAL